MEEKTIASVIENCLPYVDEVLVVNDGSTDGTSSQAKKTGAHVIDLDKNMGVANATKVGVLYARGDILVTLDADGQHNPTEIPLIIKPIIDGAAELVMGERPVFPHFSERVLTWLTSLRVPCSDASTGFRAIKSDIAKKMNYRGVCLCGTFVLEAAILGARVMCVPITICDREGVRRIQTRHFRQFLTVLNYVLKFKIK
jgi:glycosyltransferase involved in cell wall biosynthesis